MHYIYYGFCLCDCTPSEYYMNNEYVHVKNERLCCSFQKDTIANQICHVIVGERKKKLV
jgi:hypothetical protein